MTNYFYYASITSTVSFELLINFFLLSHVIAMSMNCRCIIQLIKEGLRTCCQLKISMACIHNKTPTMHMFLASSNSLTMLSTTITRTRSTPICMRYSSQHNTVKRLHRTLFSASSNNPSSVWSCNCWTCPQCV